MEPIEELVELEQIIYHFATKATDAEVLKFFQEKNNAFYRSTKAEIEKVNRYPLIYKKGNRYEPTQFGSCLDSLELTIERIQNEFESLDTDYKKSQAISKVTNMKNELEKLLSLIPYLCREITNKKTNTQLLAEEIQNKVRVGYRILQDYNQGDINVTQRLIWEVICVWIDDEVKRNELVSICCERYIDSILEGKSIDSTFDHLYQILGYYNQCSNDKDKYNGLIEEMSVARDLGYKTPTEYISHKLETIIDDDPNNDR